MHRKRLGRTGLNVSILSLGTGGVRRLGQTQGHGQDEQTGYVRRCLDLGINLIDTAQAYKESEAILGRALEGVPRESYFLCTKCQYDRDGTALRPWSALSASIENSLRSLRTDHLDIMMFHGLTPGLYDATVRQLYPSMQRVKEQGKIRFIGFSERYPEDTVHEAAALALRNDPGIWDVIMLKYGILNQLAAIEALPLAQKHDVGIINMAVIREKLPDPVLLAQTIARWKSEGHLEPESLAATDPLGWLVHGDVDSVIDAGYKFAADHPAVATVLTGTATARHLEQNVAALAKPYLPADHRQRLVDLFGRINEYA